MTPDEVRLLDNRKAVLLVRGERPILDEKYDLHKHVNVKYTEDGGAPPYDYAKAPLSKESKEVIESTLPRKAAIVLYIPVP